MQSKLLRHNSLGRLIVLKTKRQYIYINNYYRIRSNIYDCYLSTTITNNNIFKKLN